MTATTSHDDAPAVTDRALMRRVADGDEPAFTALVDRYGPRLFVVARRLLGSATDAEDAVQRTFLRCLTGARSYRPAWAVSTWLYRILTNVCIDQMRRHGTADAWRRREVRDRTGAGSRVAGGRTVSAGAADRIDRRIDLDRALARVPPEARLLLALRYADGLSYTELARARGISVNTVKSQLARGKTILRAALEGD